MRSSAGPVPSPSVPDDLVSAVALFCRKLRARGVGVALPETLAAARALQHLDLGDRREVRLGLRALLVTSVDDYDAFERTFREFWRRWSSEGPPPRDRRIPGPSLPTPDEPKDPPGGRSSPSLEGWLRQADSEGAEEDRGALRAPSSRESLGSKDFSHYRDEDLDEVARVARAIARKLARRRSRRWRPSSRGPRIHMRRTLRSSLASGGEAPSLMYRERKLKKTRLVALCDVSGSMDLYSRFLLRFLYALQSSFSRVETFVFATRLSRITEDLEKGVWREALDRLSERVRDWSGGTRIGPCLEEFADEWAELVDRRTVLLVLSDGWDTGEPEELARVMEHLHRRAGRVIWLNPLLGSSSYRPLTRGIQAALPHVDVFAPGHSLEALEELGRHLTL